MSHQGTPSCPSVVAVVDGTSRELPVYWLECDVEIHCSIAFVSLRASFLNNTNGAIFGTLKTPTFGGKATVCTCDITFAGRTYSTSVVDPGKQKHAANRELEQAGQQMGQDISKFDPNIFTMPFLGCPSNAEIVIDVKYIQTMDFDCTSGDFFLTLPTAIPPHLLYRGLDETLSITCLINPGTVQCNWRCNTHRFVQEQTIGQTITLKADSRGITNNACTISYHAWAPAISGSCIFQPPNSPNEEGAFIVFISPPAASAVAASSYRRRIVFLLDHSGSMGGSPMLEAREAMLLALDQLQPFDEFTILAFDDQLLCFSQGLQYASHRVVEDAKRWVSGVNAAGGTDILGAYKAATSILDRVDYIPEPIVQQPGYTGGYPVQQQQQQPFPPAPPAHHGHGHHAPPEGFAAAATVPLLLVPPAYPQQHMQQAVAVPIHEGYTGGPPQQQSLPIIVLVTDGAVSNEREICDYARDQSKRHPERRTYTFGIGPFCNKYFLKMLAVEGRGHSDQCLCNETIRSQMSALMSKTMGPVLCNLTLSIDPALDRAVTLYPEALPDLTTGAPVIVAGKYGGNSGNSNNSGLFNFGSGSHPMHAQSFPSTVTITGSDTHGARVSFTLATSQTENVPVHQLVDRNRIDIIVGKWWMAESQAEKNKLNRLAIDTSTNSGIPCPFTQCIAYENPTPPPYREGYQPLPAGYVPGVAPPVPVPGQIPANNNIRRGAVAHNKASPAMIGGAVVLGTTLAAAIAFGSIAATSSNIGIESISGIFSMGGNLGFPDIGGLENMQCCCCSLPSDICGFNPADVCGGCSCFGDIGNFMGCGDCNMGDGCVRDGCGPLVSGCSDACGPLAAGCSNCNAGEMLGTLGSTLGQCFSNVWPLVETALSLLCACIPD